MKSAIGMGWVLLLGCARYERFGVEVEMMRNSACQRDVRDYIKEPAASDTDDYVCGISRRLVAMRRLR